MKFGRELLDPWALFVGALAGGAAAAVSVPAAAAAGIGAAVWGVKAAVSTLMGREKPGPAGRLLPVRDNSPEQRWLRRGERAAGSLAKLSSSVRPGPIAQKTASISEQARTTIEAMRRLAGQTSAVASALRHLDGAQLANEEERLRGDMRRQRDPDIRQEVERSLESVRDQLAVHERLERAGRTLLARMESGAIGLEGLVARLAEVLALSETSVTATHGTEKIDELADELEGLRAGLAETEDLSRRALSAYHEAR